MDLPLPPIVARLRAGLPDPGRAWLVGGAVRDLLLGRPLRDLDLAVETGAIGVAGALARALDGALVVLDEERDVARVVLRSGSEAGCDIDVAGFRAPDLAGDLAHRDFSINAIALSLGEPPDLVDPVGGAADLEAGRIRVLGRESLVDDPLRGLRGVRFAAELGFEIDAESRRLIAGEAARLDGVAGERIREELVRCLLAPDPRGTMLLAYDLGLLQRLLPEIESADRLEQEPSGSVWRHTLDVIAAGRHLAERAHEPGSEGKGPPPTLEPTPGWGLLDAPLRPLWAPLAERLDEPLVADRPRRWILLLACLVHDLGPPAEDRQGADGETSPRGHYEAARRIAERLAGRLHLSHDETRAAAAIVSRHGEPRDLVRRRPFSDRELHRICRDLGEHTPEIVLVSLADLLAQGDRVDETEWRSLSAGGARILEAALLRHDEVVDPDPLVTGADLVRELGLEPGPEIGRLLTLLREERAAGAISTPDQALAAARAFHR